jgi:hypothetical protein
MTYSILCNKDNGRVMQFCYENVELFCKSYARMISYWMDCFGYTRNLEKPSN